MLACAGSHGAAHLSAATRSRTLFSGRCEVRMATTNRQVRLRARPDGIPQAHHFEVVDGPLDAACRWRVPCPDMYPSVDPAMRGWVSAVANYSKPVGIGEVMRSFAVGEVARKPASGLCVGDPLVGMFGWQHFADSDGSNVIRRVREHDLPLSA